MSGRGFDIRDRGKHVLNIYLFFSSDFSTGLTGRKAGRRHMKGRRAPRMEKVEGLLDGGRRVRNSVNFQTLQNPTETPDMWPPSTLPTWGGEEGLLGLRFFILSVLQEFPVLWKLQMLRKLLPPPFPFPFSSCLKTVRRYRAR